jgi:Polyketide cyclase / dehydrase and lipid transport
LVKARGNQAAGKTAPFSNRQERSMLDSLIPVLAVIGTAAIAFLVYVARLPGAFRVERSAQINAPAEVLFPLINNLAGFNRWNPFAKADPDATISYDGPESGVGAAYDWRGKRSGAGRMQITTSAPSKVTMALDFSKPFVAHNTAEFTLVPHGEATTVTWAMTGTRPFSHKLMGTLFSMDKMVGGEFAKGLADLKAMTEKQSTSRADSTPAPAQNGDQP